MKAKNIFTIVAAAVALMYSVSSCDFLEVKNPSTVTTEYYNTKLGQERLIVNLYSRCRDLYSDYVMQYLGTDMYLTSSDTPLNSQFGGYNPEFSGLSGTDANWKNHYKMVQESNILLTRCTQEIAGKDFAYMTSQARFFRALAYYYLVETYGPVPLLKEEKDAIITEVTRNSEEEIYSFIISELESIKGILPERAEEPGRLSDAAVRILLGKCYLTRSYRTYKAEDDAEKAAGLFQSVISSGSYKLLPQFKDVFSEENQNNEEIIWAVQYGINKDFNGQGNNMHLQFGYNVVALFPGDFVQDPMEYPLTQRNIWVNPIVHTWFRHPELDNRYDVTFKREFYINDPSSSDYGKLGLYFPYPNDDSGDDKGAKRCYPFLDHDGNYNWVPAFPMMNWNTDLMPMCHKFKDTKIKAGEKGTREDIVYRLADAYFLLAEAYLQTGEPEKAMETVNVILKRAAGGNDMIYNKLKISDTDDMTIDRLLEEKGCEMFGEHDRWYDLKRTGTLLSRARLNPIVKHYDNLTEMHLVRPIPYNETVKLKGLDQNPGYRN